MADQVLTDDEVIALGQCRGGWMATARAVEAAVLGKLTVKATQVTMPPGVAAIVGKIKMDMESAIGRQYVTEREARKRERRAWDGGTEYTANLCRAGRWGSIHGVSMAERDCRYPLPTKTITRPRTVVLRDGTKVRQDPAYVDRWRSERGGDIRVGVGLPFNFADCPADARALADLVESPMETVEVADD